MSRLRPLPDSFPERIRIKRIYRAARNSDGMRVLVDRVWPRGMSKERARLGVWMKDVAPSTALRKWFHHNTERWEEFRERYLAELQDRESDLDMLAESARTQVITLLYASADEERNNAVVLREHLLERVDDEKP